MAALSRTAVEVRRPSLGSAPRPRAWGRRARRGFTLIELLVALTGGLFISVAVFAMARDASRFYQREGRLANATLAAVVGFDRLRADIARAGFLGTPNIQADPLVCDRPITAGTSKLLFNLASVWVGTGSNGSPSNAVLDTYLKDFPGKRAHKLLLSGSYSSADEYLAVVSPNSAGSYSVYLQLGTSALARLGWDTASPSAKALLLAQIFAAGRGLRIVDTEGRAHFGVISAASVDPGTGQPLITLQAVPALTFSYSQTRLCGIAGHGENSRVSVINFIQYDIRSLKDNSNFSGANANYADLYSASATASGKSIVDAWEQNRAELVRAEFDVDNNPLTVNSVNLEELVAEYAVDLRIGVTAVTTTPPQEPALTHLDEGDTGFETYTSAPSNGGLPQRVRALRVRLSVRSREADRDEQNFAGGLYRIALGASGKGPFARVRTLQSDVILNNNAGVQTW